MRKQRQRKVIVGDEVQWRDRRWSRVDREELQGCGARLESAGEVASFQHGEREVGTDSSPAAVQKHCSYRALWRPLCAQHGMQLSKTHALRVAAVLEDFQNQLVLLAISFIVDLEKNPHSPQEKVTLNKLIHDCHTLSELMQTFCEELEETQTFNTLAKKIEVEEQTKQMMAEHIRRVTKADFREKQALCTNLEEELENKHKLLEKFKDEHDMLESQQEEQHVKEDQLKMLQKDANDREKMLEDQIKLVKEQIKRERRSHSVSIQFLQNQQEEMKQLRTSWEERTQIMREEKTQQLNDIRGKNILNLDRLMEMRRKFRVMEQVVKEDKEEQEKLQQEQDLIKAATKIQAFWRGCMVRKGLGIHKKPEEDKKGKKKEGAKEGKRRRKNNNIFYGFYLISKYIETNASDFKSIFSGREQTLNVTLGTCL
ncbi:hypothetical protein WMY93_023681 [Mugilogobius chulae]|uniref:Dynein regulatory complex protein 9 n=1 Tax=Mugilogobius chulae TaxID=88201 RepID=A0AAW0N4W9_9GOBI